MTDNSFSIEEYKLAKERISKNETLRYQLLFLNISGFAALFGLSGQIVGSVIPFAFLGLLLICSIGYMQQTQLQRFTTAFIIERYEKPLGVLILERGYSQWSQEKVAKPKLLRLPFLRGIGILFDPFCILTVISFLGSVRFSYEFVASIWKGGHFFGAISYAGIIIVGHLPVIYSIWRRRKHGLGNLREWWVNYLPVHLTERR